MFCKYSGLDSLIEKLLLRLLRDQWVRVRKSFCNYSIQIEAVTWKHLHKLGLKPVSILETRKDLNIYPSKTKKQTNKNVKRGAITGDKLSTGNELLDELVKQYIYQNIPEAPHKKVEEVNSVCSLILSQGDSFLHSLTVTWIYVRNSEMSLNLWRKLINNVMRSLYISIFGVSFHLSWCVILCHLESNYPRMLPLLYRGHGWVVTEF